MVFLLFLHFSFPNILTPFLTQGLHTGCCLSLGNSLTSWREFTYLLRFQLKCPLLGNAFLNHSINSTTCLGTPPPHFIFFLELFIFQNLLSLLIYLLSKNPALPLLRTKLFVVKYFICLAHCYFSNTWNNAWQIVGPHLILMIK